MKAELEIKLGDKIYIMRPDFNALISMEEKCGIGIQGMAQLIMDSNVTLKMVSVIIWAGIVGGGSKELSYEQVGELIVKQGFNSVAPHAIKLLQNAMLGKKDSEVAEKNG